MRLRQAIGIGLLLVLIGGARPRAALAEPAAESRRVDVLLVADTDDPEIGESVRIDLDAMRQAIEWGIPKGKRTLTVLEGADALPERILAHYAAMPDASDATLLLYYSGHGAWSDEGHYLRMNDGKILLRPRLIMAMLAKRPHLAVVVTDCCSLYVGETALFAMPAPDPDVFRDLFFRHGGLVDLTAAKRGQEAFGDRLLGGFFTNALVQALTRTPREALDATKDGIVSWDELSADVARETAANFRRSHPRGLKIKGRKVPGQNAHVFGVGTAPQTPLRHAIRLGVSVRDDAAGVVVEGVAPDSPAAWMDVRPGDRIVALRWVEDGLDERYVETARVDDLRRALGTIVGSRVVSLSLRPANAAEVEERWVRIGP